MGIFSRLTRASLDQARAEGVRFVFNTPNRYSLPGYLKLGWTLVGRTTVMVRPLRPGRIVASIRARHDDVAEADAESRVGADPERSVDALLDVGTTLEALIARNDAHLASGIRTARSSAFLRWRYARAPSLEYRACWVGDGEPHAAMIYRRTRRRGMVELSLADLMFDEPRWGRAVVRDVLAEGQADYAVAHCAWSSPHRAVLLGAGFLPVPRLGPNFTVRLLGEAGQDPHPACARNWRLSLGDLEVF
jgi:hypothetical protein